MKNCSWWKLYPLATLFLNYIEWLYFYLKRCFILLCICFKFVRYRVVVWGNGSTYPLLCRSAKFIFLIYLFSTLNAINNQIFTNIQQFFFFFNWYGLNYWWELIQPSVLHDKWVMSRSTKKPTLWTPRKVSIRISLSMPRRITRKYTFHLLWIFCFVNHYSIP